MKNTEFLCFNRDILSDFILRDILSDFRWEGKHCAQPQWTGGA